jgi:hypothetical protein
MAAEQMADLILEFLPDGNSRVKAAESVRASGGDIKSAE